MFRKSGLILTAAHFISGRQIEREPQYAQGRSTEPPFASVFCLGVFVFISQIVAVGELVSCDMKLHSVLPGWMKILTRPCVCPQVLHGSMRLMGRDREVTTVRGVKPSR